MKFLSLLGLVLIGYCVWRLVMAVLEDITDRYYLRDVMEGREEPPWEETTVRIRRPLYDIDEDETF